MGAFKDRQGLLPSCSKSDNEAEVDTNVADDTTAVCASESLRRGHRQSTWYAVRLLQLQKIRILPTIHSFTHAMRWQFQHGRRNFD